MLLFTLLYTGVSLQKWFFGLSYTRVSTVDLCSAGAGVKAGVGVAAATTTLVNADFTLYCCLSTQFQCIFGMGGTHSSARPVTP